MLATSPRRQPRAHRPVIPAQPLARPPLLVVVLIASIQCYTTFPGGEEREVFASRAPLRRRLLAMSSPRPRPRQLYAHAALTATLDAVLKQWACDQCHQQLAAPISLVLEPVDPDDECGKRIAVSVTGPGQGTQDAETTSDCETAANLPKTAKQLECWLRAYAVILRAGKRITQDDVIDALAADGFDHGVRMVREALAEMCKGSFLSNKPPKGYGPPAWA